MLVERPTFPNTSLDHNPQAKEILIDDLIIAQEGGHPAYAQTAFSGIFIEELVACAPTYDYDIAKMAEGLGMRKEEVEAGAAYYRLHKTEIDDHLEELDFWHSANM